MRPIQMLNGKVRVAEMLRPKGNCFVTKILLQIHPRGKPESPRDRLFVFK